MTGGADLAEVGPRATLEWDRGTLTADCERADIVRAGVETYLGRTVFAPDSDVVVRVSLVRVQEGGRSRVVARVTQRDDSGRAWGERSVMGESDCASLDEPLTLVVALLLDAPLVENAPQPSPVTPEPPIPDPPRGPIETAPSLQRELASPAHAAVFGFGSGTLGLLPRAAAGFGLAMSLKPRGFWGIGLEAELLPAVREGLGTGAIVTSLLTARANLCPIQGANEDAWWSACASLGVARLSVASEGLLDARERQEWLAVPGLSVRAGWRWHRRWMVVGGLVALFPVSPDSYTYRDPQGQKHAGFAVAQLGLATNLGVGAFF